MYGGYFDEVLSQISEDVIATKPKVYSYHDVTAALDSRNNTPSVIRATNTKLELLRTIDLAQGRLYVAAISNPLKAPFLTDSEHFAEQGWAVHPHYRSLFSSLKIIAICKCKLPKFLEAFHLSGCTDSDLLLSSKRSVILIDFLL